jgi:hypothetical protein
MREVYRFFGFGSDFIRIIETLCNNRTACITFDDGTLSEPFDLGRGEAQGNTPSPVLYNMGEQILLFKLELCPEISSVFNHFLVPRNYLAIEQVPDPVFEVGRRTRNSGTNLTGKPIIQMPSQMIHRF